MTLDLILVAGVVVPLISFVFLAFFGAKLPRAASGHGHDSHHDAHDSHGHGSHGPAIRKPVGGNPWAGYVATAAIALSCLLSSYVVFQWTAMSPAERIVYAHEKMSAHNVMWARLGDVPLMAGVQLDSLTVIMFFMVTFVSTWIHVFSLGYMAHDPRYHRFFTYLSLFCFSMLGLVISNSLLFMFIFWELVGLCSYFLIGFWFEKKSASDAAIKAFVVNRVGDFGFLIGLMMVVLFLRDVSLDGAAVTFSALARDPASALFNNTLLGLSWATWMGICLFCGAVGKSAQFPLHVWLPDAMEGPTPVSALIHAATMVAAGVYLVARIFRLLTPEAQMAIAVIGCITLTLTALIAIVQTDIKRVLAYSTLSQLGYMIFGMGVGAWVGALFHLLTHAFFKALLFLGSGQVIEGCHHEQDMRRMGGLRTKMPVTCWTFFIAVLAIAGAGIPWTHWGLGGFHSKDEILAVAYQRTYLWDKPLHDEHHAAARRGSAFAQEIEDNDHSRLRPIRTGGLLIDDRPHEVEHIDKSTLAAMFPAVAVLPKWLLWLPIIIAYVTPFYMMRCWCLTFLGRPRDPHVHEHAHEKPIMYVPLVVLAVFTVLCATFDWSSFRHLVADAAHANPVDVIGARVSALVPAISGEPLHAAHVALGGIVGFAFVVGLGLGWMLYRDGFGFSEAFVRSTPVTRFVHRALLRRLYFDDLYNVLFVQGTIVFAFVCRLFDTIIVDGLVNLSAVLTRIVAMFTGRQLDMPVRAGDVGFVDGVVNGIAGASYALAGAVRRPQSGRIRMYILTAAGVVGVVLLWTVYSEQVVAWFAESGRPLAMK
jgi:NADH-quinone oxidoreductase subunit L